MLASETSPGSWPVAKDSLLQHLERGICKSWEGSASSNKGLNWGPKVVQIRRKEVVQVHKLDTHRLRVTVSFGNASGYK